MKKQLRSFVWALMLGVVVSGAVATTGCNKAEEASPVQKEGAQKGQADAFRAQQGGAKAAK